MLIKKCLISFIISLLFLSGCAILKATPVRELHHRPEPRKGDDLPSIPCCKRDIQITYLGASGFLIERGKFAVLTAPFFSNPGLTEIAGPIHPNVDLIEDGLKGFSLKNVKAILVGHAHYDHLMDVPYVVKKIKAPAPKVYGSETMKNILLNLNKESREREIAAEREEVVTTNDDNIVALNKKAAAFWTPGEWVCFNREGGTNCDASDVFFRLMAIMSEHAPHFAGWKFFSGVVDPDEEPATTGGDWKEGQTLTYVMDFLGPGKTVDLRIHFQDVTSNPPAGFLPVFEPKDRTDRVDIAIVCVAGYGKVNDYPEGIIHNLNPRHVILSHWENFFKPLPKNPEELEVVPGTNVDEFIRRLERVLPSDAGWTFPNPGTVITFDPKQN